MNSLWVLYYYPVFHVQSRRIEQKWKRKRTHIYELGGGCGGEAEGVEVEEGIRWINGDGKNTIKIK